MAELPTIPVLVKDKKSEILYTVNNMRLMLRREVIRAGGYEYLSREYNISGSYISNVVNGVQNPGPAILRAFGFEKVVLYRKI